MIYNHMLRNALLPVITVVGVQFGTWISGSIVTETVFGWPGVGFLLIGAVFSTRFPGRAGILSRMIYGSRHSLWVAAVAVILSAGLGATVGLVSGFYGGLLENILMRICFFPLILAVAVLAIFPPSGATVSVVIALPTWALFARIVRSSVLRIKEMESVEGARSREKFHPTGLWMATVPGLAILVTVMALNTFGDWLRDELDPTLRT